MKPFKNIFLILFLFLSQPLFSQTNLSGGIYSNTTWSKAGSPYILSGDLLVGAGVILHIEPGVTVLMKSGSHLDLAGTLIAEGTANDSIKFQSADSGQSWFSIRVFLNGNSSRKNQLTMKYCEMSDAFYCVEFMAAMNGPYTFDNCYFHDNVYVNLNVPTGADEIRFNNCLFERNGQGVQGGGSDAKLYVSNSHFKDNYRGINGGHVSNCLFTGNTILGAYLFQSIENCEFYGNKMAVQSHHHANTYFTNNNIHDNEIGVEILAAGSFKDPNIVFRNNKICHNTEWNINMRNWDDSDLSDNCWCSTDSAYIRSTINDAYNNTGRGKVIYSFDDTACEDSATDIVQVPAAEMLSIHPNPFTSAATVKLDYQPGQLYTLQLINLTGKIVWKNSQVTNDRITLDRQGLQNGLYILQLIQQSEIISYKKVLLQ